MIASKEGRWVTDAFANTQSVGWWTDD